VKRLNIFDGLKQSYPEYVTFDVKKTMVPFCLNFRFFEFYEIMLSATLSYF
jgi:hypothetical protein